MDAITSLFLSKGVKNKLDRIKELDFEVFLSNLFMHLTASINLEKEERDKFLM